MNHDERFEDCLRKLVRDARTDEPTRAWKASILAAATAPPTRLRPPRLLTLTWAAAWLAIALLTWSQPEDEEGELPVAAAPVPPGPILFADQRQLLEQLDLP